jgi:hydrogenase-4 component H
VKLPCLLQWRILKLALASLFGKPFTTRFPRAPFEPVPEFRGRPRFRADACIGCGACAEVCPSPCIDLSDHPAANPPVRRLVQHLDACIACGQCERYCPTQNGIRLTNEWDFVGFKPEDFEEKVEKELLRCEGCGCVIAPTDQLRWLARRLGPLAFTNPTLLLVSHQALAVVEEGVQGPPGEPGRAGRVSIQCPRCRRKTALIV